jgi:mono/diheme cytochrome c family protein
VTTSRPARILLVVAAPAVALLLAACGGGSAVAKPSDPVLAKGQDIYVQRCAQCHGDKGQGGTGPKLGGGRAAQVYPNIADQEKVVKNGISGTSMPAWATVLNDDEIAAVSRYERETLPGQ